MMYAYVTDDDEMQVVDSHGYETEVYNFPNIYSQTHSHIHYDDNGKRVIRSLNNPYNDLHGFYPTPDQLQYSAIRCYSVYDFPYAYEQLRCLCLDSLSIEQLIMLKEYLSSQSTLENNNVLVRKKTL